MCGKVGKLAFLHRGKIAKHKLMDLKVQSINHLRQENQQKRLFKYIGQGKKYVPELSKEELLLIGDRIEDSIAVDGAWNNNTGLVEYQGVYLKTYEVLFHIGPLEDGTINMVEFLAIVHALALCKQWHWKIPIYSDSKIALGWIRDKKAKTNHPPSGKNKKLFEMLSRAEKWLESNTYENNRKCKF